jgi:hypothetical protein
MHLKRLMHCYHHLILVCGGWKDEIIKPVTFH